MLNQRPQRPMMCSLPDCDGKACECDTRLTKESAKIPREMWKREMRRIVATAWQVGGTWLCWNHALAAGMCPECGRHVTVVDMKCADLREAGMCHDCFQETQLEAMSGDYDDEPDDHDDSDLDDSDLEYFEEGQVP